MGASVSCTPVNGVKAVMGLMLVGVVLLASGCGKDEPKRSALAESLAQLCEQARAETEDLGLPAEKGFVVMKPTAAEAWSSQRISRS